MAQEELQESKLTKAGGRKPTHGCNYPMVGWPSVILTPMGPSLNLTREGTSRPSLRSSLSLSHLRSSTLCACNASIPPHLYLQAADYHNCHVTPHDSTTTMDGIDCPTGLMIAKHAHKTKGYRSELQSCVTPKNIIHDCQIPYLLPRASIVQLPMSFSSST